MSQSVGEHFYCFDNPLTSLKFCPQEVGGSFYCNDNQLTTLEVYPQEVRGLFYCNDNSSLGEIQHIQDFSIIYQ